MDSTRFGKPLKDCLEAVETAALACGHMQNLLMFGAPHLKTNLDEAEISIAFGAIVGQRPKIDQLLEKCRKLRAFMDEAEECQM